ncbi:hypothetical protein KC19_11G032900 [Ceratodon purpureus]|uniref:Kinesin motor domain-containing protein n=1 Tax=Ceratodon purpureus TaxID=3225 RepID=A0A8T0GCU9_CERPU|nr:hypothetical protein KC19_11G032900 [Ceratodon purpureus]
MGRGTSPLRSMVRGSPKKPSQENMDANVVSAGELTPTRKPLSSISEGCRDRNVSSDENVGDAVTPKGKADGATPKGKKRGGQCLFPLSENIEGGTLDRQAKVKKAHSRHPSPVKSQPLARVQESSVVEAGVEVASGEMAHAAAGIGVKLQAELQGVVKQGGENANAHTPRAHVTKDRGGRHGLESEPASSARPNCNQAVSATPAKSVTRTLKYGAAQGLAAAGPSASRALIPLPTGARNGAQGATEQQFNLEEDPTFWLDHNVQVLIRTRPINSSEMVSQGFSKCLKQESPHTLTWVGPPETRFTFDHVAGEVVSQEKLFNVAGLPMVENCMAGYNSCMFAYGQTGSGKTHTMLGDIEHLGDRPSENRGMTPRVFEYLFSKIKLEEEQRKDESLKFLTKCSFLEIYNEQITDLLEPTSTNLQMREDVRKGVYVENLTEIEVNSVQDVIQLLSQGSSNRKVAATNMNRESSRSHSVFTCIIESRWERDSMTNIRFGRLNLVDLAGSERQKTSGAEGERLKEAANINKSLSTLGLVIMILVDVANGKQRHVPYRDSKLTFLLQDSLGGNSKTTIIATVSPSSCNALETLSTLKFAQRAKLIRNTAVINEDASGDVKALRAQIQQMKEELDRLRRQSISRIPLSQDDFNLGRGSFDSWGDAHKFFGSPQVSSRKLRQMEAVVAGALRREQAADVTTKRLAAEIEQLNRLVHQREADTQSSKMILRFREDKIRRLETLSKGLLSVDSFLADEQRMLMEELELMREKVDRNPELTRFAMENIRLLDQIRSLQEFHEGGEKDAMLEEIANLRDQLLEVLDGKIAVDQGLVPLTTPQQKKALAPELAAAARENDLLRLEADNYRSEVEELRSNLSSSLESYSKMGRQVDELQGQVEKLKAELAAKGESTGLSSMIDLELENSKHLELIAELKLQLEQSEEKSNTFNESVRKLDRELKDSLLEAQNLRSELEATKEAFEAARALTKKLQSKEAALVGAQYAAAVKQIRLETEEMAVQQSQSLTNIQEMAVLFRMKETELRTQLDDAQQMIQKLSASQQERKSCGVSGQLVSGSGPSSVRAEDGSFERLQKAQEIEMRHAEEVMQLQLELESLEAVLDEERAQKKDLEEKLGQVEMAGALQSQEEEVAKLAQQLREAEEMISKLKAAGEVRETTYFDAVSRLQLSYSPDQKPARLSQQLDHERAVMEALENQHLSSIQEFEALQAEHTKVLEKLKRREERERILRKKIDRLEHELMKEQEIRDLEQEYAHLEEVDEAGRLVLEKKLEDAKRQLKSAHAENLKLKEEESEKDLTRCQAESETVLAITSMQAEIVGLKAEAEVADRELAAARETASDLGSQVESVRMMLSDAQNENLQVTEKYQSMLKVKDSEIEALRKDWQSATVKLIDYLAEGDQALNEASSEMEQIFCDYLPSSARSSRDSVNHSKTNEKRSAVEQLKEQLQHAQELAKDTEGRVRVLSETAFAMATAQAQETPQKVHHLSVQAAEAMEVLQREVDSSRQKLLEFEKNATVMSVLMLWLAESVEAKEMAGSIARAELKGMEVVNNEKELRLSQLRNAQETDQALLRESEEKVSQLLEDLEDVKGVAAEREKAVADLASESARLQLALEALETERKDLAELKEKAESAAAEASSAAAELKEELALARSQLKEAEEKASEAAAAHESLAIVKEEWEAEKTGLQSDIYRLENERSSGEAEMEALRLALAEVQARCDGLSSQLLEKEAEQTENVEAWKARESVKDCEIAELKEQSEVLSRTSARNEEELSESRKELETLQAELQVKQALVQEVEARRLEAVQASEQLMKEKDEKLAALKEESERMSCMSVKKEDGEVVDKRRLEILQEEIRARERALEEVEKRLLESVQSFKTLGKEKDEAISELNAEINRLSSMYAENSGELSRLREELHAIKSELETRESLLQELQTRVEQADLALEKVAGEKVLLESQLESMTLEASVAASRLCEVEEAQSVLQDKVAVMETRIVEYEDKEQSLMTEIEELSTVRNMSDEDVIQLQNEVVELRRERDSLNLEVSTMDMQSAISDRLQFIQSMCIDTDDRISSMQSEIEDMSLAKKSLEAEVQSIEVRAARLVLELAEREGSLEVACKDLDRVRAQLMDASQSVETQSSDRKLAEAEFELQAVAESIESMTRTIDGLNKSRADKEDECVLLQERLEKARANRMQAQDKLDALSVVMHEFSLSEESWRNEKGRIMSEVEMLKSQVAEKEAQFLALGVEKGALETRLQAVAAERDAALASIASLGSRADKSEAIGKSAGKDFHPDTDEVELAKARAALAGAEEKVKLLVNANATMTDEWEGERSRLNADKELLQLEISRLEKPVLSALDQNNCTPEDYIMDELKQVMKRSSADCENLRSKLRERDNTILSVKLQLEEAMVHYKETEIEMEKMIREKEDAIARIVDLEAEVTNAQEEIMRRREQMESFDLELENVVVRVTDSEAQWRAERDQLESERDDARAMAIEIECGLRDQLECERDAARAEVDENAAPRKRLDETKNVTGDDDFSGQDTRREVESVNLSLDSIAAFALAKEEVDLTKNHCEKEMETLVVGMKSLRADISSSFFEFPVVEIQEDVKSIIEAHRIEICSLTEKVEGLESLLADSRTEVSALQAALQNAQEVLQKSVEEGKCVGPANSQQAADVASACADLENIRVELEMSEAAVSQLLATVSERDATLSVLESTLEETQEHLAQIEAELAANQEEARAAKSALCEADQLRTQVLALQRQVAQKEELIKGLEYDINLVEESGAAEAENATKTINQLQKELDEKSGEVKRLRDQTAIMESELGEKLTSMEENLVATNANAAEAAVENANLCARVAGFEKKAEEQCQLREEAERELRQWRQPGLTVSALESRDAQAAKQSLERKLKFVEAELSMAHQRRESLQSQCDEKDRQIKALNAQVSQLALAAGRQTAENQQKVKGLEALMENGSAKSLGGISSMGPSMDFRNADVAARRRIEELEALAAARLKEVYGLNAKIAELESEMHDVVRELVRTNLDVQNFKVNQPQVKEIVAAVRWESLENHKTDSTHDGEVGKLRKKLNEFIEERDSWLEEIQRKQAEMVAARISAEKLRFRDDALTAENENLKTQTVGLQKRVGELEQEVKKLSGQQNLQQRIHHHAKIKEENNSLRLQVEDLGTKMRRSEMMFARVKDELERYRIAAGKTPFPNFDEEQRLRSKLQEAEESKIQLAQQFITLSNAIHQAAGDANFVRQVDQSGGLDALRKLESRLRAAEDEVSEFKLKTRISGEKRRLSELRTLHTPVKSNPGVASQQFFNSPAAYRR